MIRATGPPILAAGPVWLLASGCHHDLHLWPPAPALCINSGWQRPRTCPACRDTIDTAGLVSLGSCASPSPACDLAGCARHRTAALLEIPLVWGCIITASDVLLVLYLQTKASLCRAIVSPIAPSRCFAAELIFSKPPDRYPLGYPIQGIVAIRNAYVTSASLARP